MKVESTV